MLTQHRKHSGQQEPFDNTIRRLVWPHRYLDVPPLDFFFVIIDELKASICAKISIPHEMFQQTMGNIAKII